MVMMPASKAEKAPEKSVHGGDVCNSPRRYLAVRDKEQIEARKPEDDDGG